MANDPKLALDFFLKGINLVGKIGLITLGSRNQEWYFKVIDVVTQDASLFKFIVEHHRNVNKRMRPVVITRF